MGFLQDLGNVFHSIGHFITGGDNAPQNQPQNQPQHFSVQPGQVFQPQNRPDLSFLQPQAQQPQVMAQPNHAQALPTQNQPKPAPKPQQLQRAPQAPAPQPQQQPQIIPNHSPANLMPVGSPLANNAPVNANSLAAAAAFERAHPNNPTGPESTGDRVVNTIVNGVARAGIGIPQAAGQLWDMITPGKGTSRFTKGLDAAAKEVDDAQAGKTDNGQSAGLQGRFGNDLYKGTQVAANIALPGGALGDAAKVPDLIKAAPDIISNLPSTAAKAADLVKAVPGKVSAAAEAVDRMMQNTPATLERVAATATDSKAALDSVADKAPHEAAVGVSSANPTQTQDFTDALNQKAAQEAAQTPAPQPVVPHAMNDDETAQLDQLNKDSKTRVLTPQEQQDRAALQGKADMIDQTNNPQPVETPNESPTKATQPTSGRTAQNAPNVRAQAEKDLNAASNGIDIGKATEHDVLSNDQLNDAANRYVQSMKDDELKASVKDGMTVSNAGDIAKAYATVRRLGVMAKNGDAEAKAAIPKILDSVEQATSGGARQLNYVGSMLDSMPKEAQEEYLIKSINKSRTANGLEVLSDQEEAATRANLQKYLEDIEDKKNAVAGAQGKLEDLMMRAEKGEATADETSQIPELKQTIADNTREINQLNTEVGKQYADVTGAKGNAGKSAGANARALMLTKLTGRLSDVATTGINQLHTLAQSAVESGLGKLYNKLPNQSGRVIDTMPSVRAYGRGLSTGKADLVNDYKGNVETPDLYTAIKGTNKAGKEQMGANYAATKVTRGLQQTAHALTNTATNLSQGLSDVKIQQLAEQEAAQKGLTGDDAKIYAAARAANPTRQMQQAGQKLVDEANNMNDNPLSDLMSKISNAFNDSKFGKALDNSKGGKMADFLGETVRNVVAPFTHWAATAAWNGATDKNAVANFVKAAAQVSFKDGKLSIKDPQELMHQLAGLTVNGGAATGVGYALASHGMLTTHNAEGYNDDGLYLHVGGEYIPVGFMGFFAPGIVMGAAAHQAFSDKGPGSMMDKIAKAAGDAFMQTLKSDLTNTVIGGSNEFVTQFQNMLQSKEGTTPGDVAATAATDAAGNYIPGIFGDVNTGLNMSPLNPNHEAALTKVTKGELGQTNPSGDAMSTAKDIPRSDVNALINKVPVASQKLLPRNPGVAANNFASNITRGDNESKDQASVNKSVDQLPQNQQQTVRNLIRKSDAGALQTAQATANAAPAGMLKEKAQAAADKLAFNAANSNPVQDAIHTAKVAEAKTNFVKSDSNMQTINGTTYAKIGGSVKTFSSPLKAQQAIDKDAFTKGSKDFASMNGMVYQRGSDGKVTSMEQKDYDYQKANDGMSLAKTNGDLNSYTKSAQDLLGNIEWQLNHADLTDHQRTQLEDKGQTVANDLAKYQSYGGFTKPKGAGRGGSGSSKVTQNKIGSLPQFTRFDFSNLSAKPNTVQLPQVKLTDPETLIKKRNISVTAAR